MGMFILLEVWGMKDTWYLWFAILIKMTFLMKFHVVI
jgi:hypothetical protein